MNLIIQDLSSNEIERETFEILVDTIQRLPSLISLSLADCALRDSFGQLVGNLCRLKTIQHINLSGNRFEDVTCIYIGHALSRLFKTNSFLFNGQCSLPLFLAENNNLISLNLSWNCIRSLASIALFRGFEVRAYQIMMTFNDRF
jgi:Leucine-rich repeat (LRR) protein